MAPPLKASLGISPIYFSGNAADQAGFRRGADSLARGGFGPQREGIETAFATRARLASALQAKAASLRRVFGGHYQFAPWHGAGAHHVGLHPQPIQ